MQRPIPVALASVVLFALACTTDGDGDTGGETQAHETEGHDTTAASVTGETGNESGENSGETAHASEETTHDSGETAGHDTSSEHGGTDTSSAELNEQWCFCMLNACHDVYHATFGEEHPGSEEACLAAAAAVPSNRAPTEMGNFIECRVHFCEQADAAQDESFCESAIGGGMCM